MKMDVKFSASKQTFSAQFGQSLHVTDAGYESGYADGKAEGYSTGHAAGFAEGEIAGHAKGYTEGHDAGTAEGYTKGHEDGVKQGYADGLAARTYETWTITLTDGTVVEKEVALL